LNVYYCVILISYDSAKSLRRAQNARAYAKTHCRRTRTHAPTTNIPHCVFASLPASLVVLAATPLPNTFLFHQALEDPDAIDESDLPQWDAWPPYPYNPPSDTPAESRFTKSLEEVMHGRNLRLEREARAQRASRFNAGETAPTVLINEIREILETLVRNWIALQDVVVSLPVNTCERHRVMAALLLHWQARTAHVLHGEGQLLRVGLNPYENLDVSCRDT
jgi:hypothetical protein